MDEDGLHNPWVEGEGEGFHKQWSMVEYQKQVEESECRVKSAIFVECFNQGPMDETKWALAMAADPNSIIDGVVAHIPVTDGAEATEAFLAQLRDESGTLPFGLKGARNVFLGDPMPAADACMSDTFYAGLAVLEEAGLHWEFACQPCALPHVTSVCTKFPNLSFVLDHLGHNAGGEDYETWAPAITELAKCRNVTVKLGAIEEWAVADPAPFLDHAIREFGYDRCMYESNWFVSNAMGDKYDSTFKHIQEACTRLGATEAETAAIFSTNATRVYKMTISEA